MKPILALDLCNTLADINAILSSIIPIDPNVYPAPGVSEELFEDNPWLFSKAEPFEGASKVVSFLSDYWEVVYVTARPEWSKMLTRKWLKDNAFPEGDIICTKNKAGVVRKIGAFLAIDDSPHEIISVGKFIPVCIPDYYNYNRGLQGKRFKWDNGWKSVIMPYHPAYYPKALS